MKKRKYKSYSQNPKNGKVKIIKPAERWIVSRSPYIPKHIKDIMAEE